MLSWARVWLELPQAQLCWPNPICNKKSLFWVLSFLKSATRLGVQWTSDIMLLWCFPNHFFFIFVLVDIWPNEKMGAFYHPWGLIICEKHYWIKNFMICFESSGTLFYHQLFGLDFWIVMTYLLVKNGSFSSLTLLSNSHTGHGKCLK